MNKDVTRREMAVVLLGSAPANAEEKTQEAPLAAVREQVRKSPKKLDDFDLPMATEPAFIFKP